MNLKDISTPELEIIYKDVTVELKKRLKLYREKNMVKNKTQIQAECEWDFGVGLLSVWDDLESAQIYFKEAFKDYGTDIDYTYEDALTSNLLIYKEI